MILLESKNVHTFDTLGLVKDTVVKNSSPLIIATLVLMPF